ncbi:MAG: amidophosphoribosyltransferase, partial [Devosiaceae bacterium]|nr:amidophosphoribosyltransferase [Devosiaceae bacterium]
SLRRQIIEQGAICQSTSDSEVVLHLIAQARQTDSAERFIEAISQVEGGYAIVALTRNKLIGARDPNGIRPLVYGEFEGKPIFASETCALDIIGATFIRDVAPGETLICQRHGDGTIEVRSHILENAAPERLCLFEYVYFSRPDSIVGGRSVYSVRKNMGAKLAAEAPIDADVVVPIPDGGVPAALGFAQAVNIPYEYGIIRNHYVGRTFIEPSQRIRALGVKLKHSANREQIKGKRVILVDDSIVRGTTTTKIVQMIRDAGALEVHIRVACPQIIYPDFYGIDTPDADQLLSNQFKTVEEMCAHIGADSLAFLSIDGLYRAVCSQPRNAKSPQFTDHYFTGDYPTVLTDMDGTDIKIPGVSMLKEAI